MRRLLGGSEGLVSGLLPITLDRIDLAGISGGIEKLFPRLARSQMRVLLRNISTWCGYMTGESKGREAGGSMTYTGVDTS